MKLKLLLLILPIIGTFFSYSQAELVVTAPDQSNATTGVRAPNGTTSQTTVRGVIIVTAAELAAIPTGTTITKLNMILADGATPGPASGNIQYYLENTSDVTNLKSTTWATCISTMTSVYSGNFSIPSAAGPTPALTLTTNFVYSGGSVYVAYDYLGSTFTSTGATYEANHLLAGGWKGLTSATTTPPASITGTSGFRPCFQFTFANPFTNELNVSGVAGEKGIFNNAIQKTQTVTSQVTNTSVGTLSSIPVTLSITGANPYTIIHTIPSIAAGTTETISFNNVPTSNTGAQTITITIPADEDITNNMQVYNQQVQCDTIGYTQGPIQGGAVGFNNASGVIAVRHIIPGGFETFVSSVSNYFPISVDNSGNSMKGLLINSSGLIIDSTNSITVTPAMLGTKQDFNFINGAIDVSGETIYVGFRQTANSTTGYFPFSTQTNSYIDPNAAATFATIYGGLASPLGDGLGYMMIDAVLSYDGFEVANSSVNGELCENSVLTISPTTGFTNYDFFINGVSAQNDTTPTYTTGPLTSTTTYNVEITNGSCVFSSNLETVVVIPSTDSSITIVLCESTYLFEGQTLTSSGVYTETIPNSNGCDSTITLDLTLNTPTTVTASLSGATLTATATPASASYQWIDCATNTNVTGATSAVFNPTVNGEYAVIATSTNGCSDTSACIVVSTVGIKENNKSLGLSIFPNPTSGTVNVLLENMESKQYTLELIDATGRKLITKTINDKSTKVDMSSYGKGVYMIRISNETRSSTHRIVKN